MRKSHIILAFALIIGVVSFIMPLIFPNSPINLNRNPTSLGLIITLLIILTITAFIYESELVSKGSKEIALISILGTISAVSRIPFAAIPSVQPCTYLILCAGYTFGPVTGFTVGALTPLISNFFLGQGPWTLYQMFAWGLVGASSAFLRRLNCGRLGIMAFGFAWGYLFGAIMNLWHWSFFIYPHTFLTFLAVETAGLWFDTLHAAGNIVFLGLFGVKTLKILERFRKRFDIKIQMKSMVHPIEGRHTLPRDR